MKRDMDLVRTILLTTEAGESPLQVIPDLVITGYHDSLVSEHLVLMAEFGLIQVIPPEYHQDYEKIRITWDGYEFLDAARDNARWKTTKKAGSLSFDVLKSVLFGLAAQAAKQAVGLA